MFYNFYEQPLKRIRRTKIIVIRIRKVLCQRLIIQFQIKNSCFKNNTMKVKKNNEETYQELENQFSFQNSPLQTELNKQLFLTCQDKPLYSTKKKVDCDTVSQKFQISKTQKPLKNLQISPQRDMIRKSALIKIKQGMEEIASIIANIGSLKN
ncbi:unnamed protein product [Paramecium sonneborni]|uniref:Uncharacterized protein n=1 Tax=Paramecium sonneborni TaxID=65129 RepID=A0A8S1PRV6_9CILI|nr:unnamed protein product [Paramecium sonneborni]